MAGAANVVDFVLAGWGVVWNLTPWLVLNLMRSRRRDA
jgi:hypothetical protein